MFKAMDAAAAAAGNQLKEERDMEILYLCHRLSFSLSNSNDNNNNYSYN